MQAQEIGPHIETLTRALGDKVGTDVSEEDLRDEFAKYLEYGVPVDQAIRTILRHHGVDTRPARPEAVTSSEPLPLAELPPDSPFVAAKARLLTLNTKEVTARGEQKTILWGLLGDGSGTAPYTSWRPLEGLAKGDALEIVGAYTKAWNGQVQVNFGDRTQLHKIDAAEVGQPPRVTQEATVADIRDGMRGLAVEGRILNVAPREITLKTGEKRTLWGGKIADDSGAIDFTAWHDHGLEEGKAVRIEGAYVRSYRGVPQVNFDQDAVVTAATSQLPPAEELQESTILEVGTLVERGGGSDITLVGTLLEVRPGSGLIFRDPETNRVVHGPAQSKGVPDLRIKGVLDDGTGAVNMVVGRPLTERLLGKTLEECQEEARAAFRHEVIHEQLAEKLTSRAFRVTGNALADEYGIMLIVQDIQTHEVDVAAHAARLLEEIGGEA